MSSQPSEVERFIERVNWLYAHPPKKKDLPPEWYKFNFSSTVLIYQPFNTAMITSVA